MIRRLFICSPAVAAAVCAAGVGPARAASATAPPAGSARLASFACRSTLAPASRSVAVTSVMRPVPGTRTLSVKFSLLERAPGAAQAHRLPATGDLGRWLTPADRTLGRRAADVWKLRKSVLDVAAPAAYRFTVSFRWRGRGGKMLATTTRRTATCRERELRPDVLVRRVIVRAVAGSPRRARYVVVVANRGATASGSFSIAYSPGNGAAARSRVVASLAPQAHVRVIFSGPACDAASPPTVTADAADEVDDYDRSNNTLTVACPAIRGD